jgi:hypothetical protein
MNSQDLITRGAISPCMLTLTALLLGACGGGGGGNNPTASLSYSSPQVYVVGTAIAPLAPAVTESLSGFSVSPALPPGLVLNTATGVISGTPTSTESKNAYTISAAGPGGTQVSAALTITVNSIATNAISYGAAALTFTAGIAARTLTPQTGATLTGWSIMPQLPAGFAFNTTTGAITGTPNAASPSTMYTVSAQNSAGQPLSVNFTIEVDTDVLVDLGHDTGIQVLQFNGSRLLSEDQDGHWVLWNYATAAMIASGTGCVFAGQPGPLSCVRGPDAALAGSIAVIRTYTGFEVLSAATGALIANIPVTLDLASEDSGGAWWLLATDGSYIVAGTTTSLSAWSPSGQTLVSRSGNYSAAIAFASPGAIRIAVGPEGPNVIETVALPSGTDTVSPTFSGQFTAWFSDGSAFFSAVGTTVLIYTDAVVQEAVLNMPSGTFYGEGPWLWTFSGSSMNIYALAAPTTLVASYPCTGSAVTSASTIAVFSSTSNTLCVVNLSGATPTEALYTTFPFPIVGGAYFAAASASQWVVGTAYGVLLDGASLSGTPRYFGYGQALSIAGNANQIAIATASGTILYFNAVTLAQEGTIQFSSLQLALSPDGTILAAAPSDLSNPATQALNIYALPSGSLLYSWPYPNIQALQSISLAGSGSSTVLGQVLSSGTTMVTAPTGGTSIFSTTGQGVLQLSQDGAQIATSSTGNPQAVGPDFTGFGTNLWQNNKLVTAVSGWPAGWIDDAHLLVNTYQADYFVPEETDYIGCAIYGPTGMSAGSCVLPQVLSFQTVTSDTLYALNLNEIVSVSTGAVSWTSGDAVATSVNVLDLPTVAFMDTLAGKHVVFVSGSQVVAQSY